MKRLMAIVLAVALLAVGSGVALAQQDVTGNGAPSGPHYNLNIIGMDKAKRSDMECGDGHRIFVKMNGQTKLYLSEGDFAVRDCNGTDGRAEFQLPNPDPDNDGVTEYSVFIRVLGKPGGKIKMTTCATDPLAGEEVCSDYAVVKVRETGKGKQKFENVSRELLYIYAWVCVAVDPDTGACTDWEYMRVPLFSDLLQDYLWKYDNNGLRIAQLRFYPISTEVPEAVCSDCSK